VFGLLVVMLITATVLSFVRMAVHRDPPLFVQSLAVTWIVGAAIARTFADGYE